MLVGMRVSLEWGCALGAVCVNQNSVWSGKVLPLLSFSVAVISFARDCRECLNPQGRISLKRKGRLAFSEWILGGKLFKKTSGIRSDFDARLDHVVH